MKTLHTIYTNFAKRLAIVLFFLTTLGLSSAWAATGTLSISTRNGTTDDSQGYTWTITTEGASSSTSHGEYFQIGSSSSPATSITLTMTFPTAQKVTAFSAKFSGYGSEAKIKLKVGNTIVGEGALTTSHSTSSPVTINSTSVAVGNTLTVSVTNIKNGVNFHNLSYTYESATTQEVTWIVDGQEEEKANIPEGAIEVNRLPDDPDNCSSDIVFVGWTANPNVDGSRPADLFNRKTPNSNLPIISSTNNTFYAVYATQTEAPSTKVDALNKAKTGNPSSYTAWSGVTDQSSAVYAGNSSGGNSSIQIKDENNTGIITTQSGGKAKKVVIVWNSNTRDDAKLKIYGKNQAYSSTSELYDTNTQGTLIGTIDRNSTMLEIADDYEYIGMSSLTGAIYLTSISITWESEGSFENYTTTCSVDVTVTLNPNGGTGDFTDWDWNQEGNKYTQTIEKGNSVTLPKLDDQIAYTFGGWSDGTTTYDAGIYTPEADLELTAVWTAKPLTNFRTLCTYDIEYTNLEGAIHSNPDTYTAAILPLTFTAPTSTREGYTFAGWNPASLDENTRGDQTVTAQWQVNSHTLTWNVNDGDPLTGEYTTGSVEYGTTIIPPANPTRTGYTFAGWGAEVAQTMPNHDLVYTAQWTVNTYIITLDQHGGIGGSESIEVTYDAELPAITVPTREGYTFGGYFTSENGVGTQYYNQNGTAYYSKKWDIASATTLYAKWTPHKFTVKFNANGGDGSMEDQQFTYDIEQALSANQFTRVGYSFAGWNDKTDGSGTSYTDQQVVKNLTATKDGQKTLYAQWAAIHTITWMVNGSQAEGDPTTSVVNGQTITSLPTAPDVDCNGKVFVGWTTVEIVGETVTIPDPLYTELGDFPAVTSNMTFYAVFANGSGEERWVETDIANINSGDEVVITMCKSGFTWTISNAKNTSTAPTANDITANIQGKYLTTVDNEYKWVIEKDNANLTFYSYSNNANYLYCTNADNGVRVGTGTAKVFSISGNYLLNNATLRYLGVSLNTDPDSWRCYTVTTGVIVDQTLKFYKKTTVYTEYTNYSTSCMAGVCDITNANPIYVTSAVGQKIKATDKLVLTTTDMAIGTEISLSAPNITFYKEGVEITQLTTTAASETFELEIAYQPTIANTTEQPTITLDILGYKFTINNKITARSLPETFAIVAKVGNVWYALPSQGLNSETTPVGYPVEVDNNDNPTAVTAVPANADWSLRQVYASYGSNDRFADNGENLVFVNADNKTLYASKDNANIQTYAEYSNYAATTPGLYEWTPTTTDLETYQLTNEQRSRTLSVNTATVFGVHATDKAVEQVRFLPIQNRYTPAALQVVEWKENSVVIMYNGDLAQTASVSVNGAAAQETSLSSASAQRDIAVYELAATGLAANPTQRLSITIGTEKVIQSIPYIISGSKNDIDVLSGTTVAARQEVAKVADLVILKGATLTAAGAKGNPYKFRNVTVYGGGKLVIPSDKGFGVNSLTLRIGGVTADGNYDYVYPEFVLNTKEAYTNTSGKINLDYLTTKEQYYTFVAPFAVNTKDIKYPVDIYGSNVAANNRGSFEFQYYDGGARAAGEKGWKVVEEDPTEGATLTAHQGYTFYGMPKKVSVNGGTSTRQKFGIHRIPMSVTAANVMTHENTAQTTAVSAYPSQHNINAGWNLIGNPYMSTITGLNNESIQTGTIVLVDDRWQWSDAGSQASRFIVFPSNDGEWYYASQASNATLPAFKNFFVQIAGEKINAISIPFTHRAPSGISARRATYETDKDIEMAIVLEKDDANSDQMDFLINDAYGAGFDYNADFTKMMNNTQLNLYGVLMEDNLSFVALDHYSARGSVAIGYQVPVAGEYTLRISDKPYVMLDKIESLYVTDHEMSPAVTTNLMEEDYVFQVGKAEINDTRFTISLSAKANNDGDDVTTDMGEVDIHNDLPQKFFYDGKLYILREGKVYSATGHEIKTINK